MDAQYATSIQRIHLLTSPFIGEIFLCCPGLSIKQEKNKTNNFLVFLYFFSEPQGGLLQSHEVKRTSVDSINESSIWELNRSSFRECIHLKNEQINLQISQKSASEKQTVK